MHLRVEFLCDSICDGRGVGTRGGSEAGFYIFRSMQRLGLEVRSQSFPVDSVAGHNIIGFYNGNRSSGDYILVIAYYDGMGTLGGKLLPGADANASGTAMMLELIPRLRNTGRNYVFAALDAHNRSLSGAEALYGLLGSPSMVINLDTVGGSMAHPVKGSKTGYLIILGGQDYSMEIGRLNRRPYLSLFYDYYGSERFTSLFYRKISDHKYWLDDGIPCLMFTSGISMLTNKPTDRPATLDYGVMEARLNLVESTLKSLRILR